jgi:hypothetical protein
MADKKILLAKYPSNPGKTKIITVNFLINFVGGPTNLPLSSSLTKSGYLELILYSQL